MKECGYWKGEYINVFIYVLKYTEVMKLSNQEYKYYFNNFTNVSITKSYLHTYQNIYRIRIPSEQVESDMQTHISKLLAWIEAISSN